MIEYYGKLIHSLGGRVEAYYLDGVAVYRNGQVFSYMDLQYALKRSFYMTDRVSTKRHTGWPLDSLSVDKKTGVYFVDRKDSEEGNNILRGKYRNRLRDFLIGALGL